MVNTSGRGRTPSRGQRIAASLATVLAAVGLIAVAHLGAFEEGNDPFPHSVIAPTG